LEVGISGPVGYVSHFEKAINEYAPTIPIKLSFFER